MKIIVKVLLSIAAIIGAVPAFAYVDHVGKRVIGLQSDADRPCVIFSLEGVPQADPSKPGVQYFALSKTHPSYNEVFAFLLTAKAANLPVTIRTTGTTLTSCSGFATVNIIVLD